MEEAMPEKKQNSDFRYETSGAQIAWDAVGEKLNEDDVERVIEFLVMPQEKCEKQYNDNLEKVKSSVKKL